ncbi:hypothetical protein HAX54_046440 [Datura stramonium]|uniref:Protein SPIRAL1-like 1 n=1 Tax=Datura stramonium TaxID=4076 RepID=A0ABS8WKU6_DATST|nr:hypothetical protein [Datura stramonium]
MGRGVSSGGGQSSLGYLFGDGEVQNLLPTGRSSQNQGPATSNPQNPTATAPAPNVNKQIPAGIQGAIPITISLQMDKTLGISSRIAHLQSACGPRRWIFPWLPVWRWQEIIPSVQS